ncbi:hypothetical protein ACQ4M4_13555 [Leptolyngbya sp. AN02str]|uniref:hypothetical protein n=1 Tax=Leptolyngbya sp. AN02str TaxID=3423363 RepID=UPI003D315798
MSVKELQTQVLDLSVSDRMALVQVVVQSLRDPHQCSDRRTLVHKMKGLLRTAQPAPTDAQVADMLNQRQMERTLT